MTTAIQRSRYVLVTGIIMAALGGCARSPEAPRASPTAPSASVVDGGLGAEAHDATGVDLGACLSAPNPLCFNATRIAATSVATAPVTGPPLNLAASVNGSTVVLVWTAPSVQDAPVLSYVIDVGSSPFATGDLAHFDTGTPATTLTAPLVPTGTYFVRVRARNALGLSQPSTQIQVVVGAVGPSPGCPGPPRSLTGSGAGGLVTLTWLPPLSGSAQTYHIEAGSFAGGSNLASFNTGTASTFFSRTGVPAGVYYIRIRAVAAGCAPSAPSNEAVVTVVGTSPGNPMVTLTLAYTCSACTGDPDNYALNVDCVAGRCTSFRTSNPRSSGIITASVRMAPGVHNVEVVVRNPSSPWSLTFTASPPGAGGVVPSSFRFLEPPGGAGLSRTPCRVSGLAVESFFEFTVAGPSTPTC